MKKAMLIVLTMLCSWAAHAQIQVDSMIVKQKLKLNGYRVTGISNDTTTNVDDSAKLVTKAAVRKMVGSGGGGIMDSNNAKKNAVNTFTTRNNFTSISLRKDSVPIVSGRTWYAVIDTTTNLLSRQLGTTYAAGRGVTLIGTTFRLDTTNGYTWGGNHTFTNGGYYGNSASSVGANNIISSLNFLNSAGNGRITCNQSSIAGLSNVNYIRFFYNGTSPTSPYFQIGDPSNGGIISYFNHSFNAGAAFPTSQNIVFTNSGGTTGQIQFNGTTKTIGLNSHYIRITGNTGEIFEATNGTNVQLRLFGSGNLVLTNVAAGSVTDDNINKLQVNGSTKSSQYRLSSLNTAPISSSDTGVAGEIRITSSYVYICSATNTWVRAALASW